MAIDGIHGEIESRDPQEIQEDLDQIQNSSTKGSSDLKNITWTSIGIVNEVLVEKGLPTREWWKYEDE